MTDASPTSRSSCRNTSWPLPCCSWRELDRIGQAKLLRAVDELGTARGESRSTDFQVWAPEGFTVGVSRNKPTAAQARAGKDGNPTKIGWKNYRSIANALLAITDADFNILDVAIGDKPKVRSCFFNLVNPESALAVTIDTHSVAAAWLSPFGAGSQEVLDTLGKDLGSGEDENSGLYGNNAFVAEAHFQLAAELCCRQY